MTYLLDTHVWLWMLAEPDRLGQTTELLEDTSNDLLLSAASSWEIVIKHGLGRLPLPEPPSSFVPSRMRRSGVTPIGVDHSDVLAVEHLPPLHRDPFDRVLIAQATVRGIPLVTRDAVFAEYGVQVVTIR
jgi:PIN domain nuclease of toxin-antitoxin system